ncbi:hypothetical protein HJFPF1_01673 [Paramyrothecium foliicola]|nr:hypothetical protein HJFPF1_01673 [Paramyrothecium foliicola]
MWDYQTIFVFFALQALFLGSFVSRSPIMMASESPSTVWADQPMRLIPTPQYQTKKTDIFTTGATHMALLHNAILRGFNSIYLQAPHVQPSHKRDFVGYSLTWYRFVKSHHDDEEANLFTKIEELLDDKTIWDETHEEHEAFIPGLTEFHDYLSGLASPANLTSTGLLRIMDSFRESFEHHFHHEIAIIAALADHPRAPAEGTPEAAEASATFKAWGKKTVGKAGTLDAVPFFLLNLDATFEEGAWAAWPPMPAPIRWGLTNIAGSWYGGWWRFASCDARGKPKQLFALETPQAEAEKEL